MMQPIRLTPGLGAGLLLGVILAQVLAHLPPLWVDVSLAAVAVVMVWRRPRLRWCAAVLIGFAWGALRADWMLGARLPHDLEGQDLRVVGVVRDLPRRGDDATQFDFDVDQARVDGQSVALQGHVRLSWYGQAPVLEPCARWQFIVRLKRPRGLVNLGVYDFERHALEAGINAVGYVRDDPENRALDRPGFCIDAWRQHLSQGIAKELGVTKVTALLRALAVGDQHDLTEHDWHVLRATGVGHLIAISGMHIGMLAGFGVLLMRLFWRLRPRWVTRCPAPMLEAPFGFLCALVYSALAGFGLPTDRTLMMIGVVVAAVLLRRAMAPSQGLTLALVALLLVDPLAVLNAGFWLSFVGVAWLIFCLDRGEHAARWWRELIGAQMVMSIGLLPLTIWFFASSSLVAPVANLIAVPWISFVVVPLIIAGCLLMTLAPVLGSPLIKAAAFAMQGQWWLLEQQSAWPGAQWYLPEPTVFGFALALLGAIWLLLPRGVPGRALGAVLFLPLLLPDLPTLAKGEFEAVVVDVGQGLSVVLRTRDHVLVYDTGARYPNGFDLGEAAVVPTLRAMNISHLDRLMVSHGDNDHSGGAQSLVAAYPPDISQSGEPQRMKVPMQPCQAGESWVWNDVTFRVVHPPADLPDRANDNSCVLSVRTGDNELILPGDSSSLVEPAIAQALLPVATHVTLLVPHHGSKTSSSAAFLESLHPELAIVSAGYRSRYGHPHPTVVDRYKKAGVPLINTAESGFVRMQFSKDSAVAVKTQGRLDRHPYWRE